MNIDEQLIEAMLLELGPSAQAAREQRISRVLTALDQPPLVMRVPRSMWRSTVRWSAAAAIVIIGVLALVALQPRSAAAAVRQMIAATQAPLDRTYILITETTEEPRPGPPPLPARLPPTRRQFSADNPPPGSAILHVRGADQYVLIRQLDDGRKLITGSDGKQSWSIPPDGDVLVNADPLGFRGPMSGLQTRVPFFDLRTTLEELEQHYQLRALWSYTAQDGSARVFEQLRGDRRGRDPARPQIVHVWYDRATGVVQQIQLDGMNRRDYPRLTRLTVELIEQRDLPANWFDHTAHHAADRPVIRFDLKRGA